jgi:hypothetical protein
LTLAYSSRLIVREQAGEQVAERDADGDREGDPDAEVALEDAERAGGGFHRSTLQVIGSPSYS